MNKMGTMKEYLTENKEMRKRFIGYAFKENPKISNFEEFEKALFEYFDTPTGENASKWFNGDEVDILFNDKETKELIKENVNDEEYKKIYKGEYIIVREIPKGEKIKPSQISIVYKPIKIKRGGKTYYKSKNIKWNNAQINFLKVRKKRKLTSKQVFHEYNQHFKENPRTEKSVSSKYYSI